MPAPHSSTPTAPPLPETAAATVEIVDVSPTWSSLVLPPNTNAPDPNHSVIGRMLSIACTPDGETVYVGSYSNLWVSGDAGQNWEQLTWPQPPPEGLDVPGALGGWCVVDIAAAPGWRVDRHPRILVRLTPKGHTDIVGFGECGVWTALGRGDGTFRNPNVVLANFGYQQGWRVEAHPRYVRDLTGDGHADITGFGDAGVWTALGTGNGSFGNANFVLANFGYQQGWRVDMHPRAVVDLTGDGHPDIVGFGDAGVWTALGNGDGTFGQPNYVLANFGVQQGWRVDRHPRFVVDLTGDGHPDILGFGDAGVWVARGNGDGTFADAVYVLANFGYNQGWRVDRHPRALARLTPSGHVDIVGFGDAGVWTSLGNGDGTFRDAAFVLANLGYQQGWRVDAHPRSVADLTGDGNADIVGFGDAGVWTALGRGDGTFQDARFVVANLGYQQGWRVDRHPRSVIDLTGDGRPDIVGFGDAGVWTALGQGDGTFREPHFVLAGFGYGTTVLAITRSDLAAGSRGIWRSSDGGASWAQVHQFPGGEAVGQLVWALGSDHLVYAAGGSSLAISKNGGISFGDVFPWGQAPARRVNHVAVWQNEPADPAPAVIYALGDSTMFLSFDGGTTWMEDGGPIPASVGGAVSPTANGNAASVMVISPRFPLELFVAQNGSGAGRDPVLFRCDYTSFPFGARHSSWEQVILPDMGGQDNGNVSLAVTQKGRGDLLFYGAQRKPAWVGPLYPASASEWKALDSNVHVDLHGILLSPDFAATLRDGHYQPGTGMVFLLSDGGIYRSTDGGQHFDPVNNVESLSCVNVAGVALPGKGPALSLNTGDNDGFYSMDGGAHWTYQQYGGGDNDCSYADPLRPNSMLVLTPRWDTTGHLAAHTKDGQTVAVYEADPGNLPDARSTASDRRAVTGPPPLPAGDAWNANSGYANRGSRPIVLSLPGEAIPAQGDYVFVLFLSDTRSVLVRTQNILDIADRSEWITTATAPGQGANVFQQGPDLPGADVRVVQASGGHAATVFYVGGDATSGLWTWTDGMPGWKRIVPGPGAGHAHRFFADPYRPNLIYILDNHHVKRSDNGGETWQVDHNLEAQLTWGGRIRITPADDSIGLSDHFDVVLTDMQFDPSNPGVRFAVGNGGAFCSIDGVSWTRLLHTSALPGRPASCYYDWISDPANPALYLSFAGRSLVRIDNLPVGETRVAVPDVFELSPLLAATTIEHAGLVPRFTGPNQRGSWVSSQSPAAGDFVPRGATVEMLLRTGPLP